MVSVLTDISVAYALGIYLLNLFLAFLQPKFDPSNDALDNDMEDGTAGSLPHQEGRGIPPLHPPPSRVQVLALATRAVVIAFMCSWFEVFNIPVFWPVLVMYWMILFVLTSTALPSPQRRPYYGQRLTRALYSAKADPAHDQIPLCALHDRQGPLHQEQRVRCWIGVEARGCLFFPGICITMTTKR